MSFTKCRTSNPPARGPCNWLPLGGRLIDALDWLMQVILWYNWNLASWQCLVYVLEASCEELQTTCS